MESNNNPSHARYQRGDWFGVVRQGTVVLLGPDTSPALIDSVWELLASAPEAHEVLHEVTEAFGVSLSRIPPFGIIDSKDALRVFLRGDLELVVKMSAGEELLSGRDVTTWTERRLTAAHAYNLRIGPGSPSASVPASPASPGNTSTPDGSLPLGEGVVLLASLDVVLQPTPAKIAGPALVSDETMIGYADADLGLTIAPGHPEIAEDSPGVPVHTGTTDPILPSLEAGHSLESTTNYDHLWDKTVMRNIEDAAVRVDEESGDDDAPAAHTPVAQTPMPHTPVPPTPASEKPAVPGPLIDSVPWQRSPAEIPAHDGRADSAAPAQTSGSADADADHDGQTVMKSSITADAQRAGAGAAHQDARVEDAPAGNGPSVLARVCSQGHANPPTYSQCAMCGFALSGDSLQVPRPRLGRMRLSTGELIDLDQSLIIGRQPSVSRVQGGTMPRLVQVESPGGDISRSHVEVRLEGWHVMLCDLKATNGTVLIREGQAPRRLAQNEMAILLDGDIAELGDDISLRFEEIL